ncbi:hypothetical protein CAL27_18870 [Bordetella genomosp. 1]|uniref:Tyr recombinase domain-containing protein n=2 Tax=Bordetella genomosp. 1 TaxID=1395607 RepID=A0ABX4EWD2_9BORD|nr:hypothetical protein CAL27_18870 [Bordetella genomosp. 1]
MAADPLRRRPVTLEQAATQLLKDKKGMPSAVTDAYMLEALVAWGGSLTIDKLDDRALAPFVAERRAAGWKSKTINNALECVRNILNRAARRWRFENGATWLATAMQITLLPVLDYRPPRPITRAEQGVLLAQLPPYLAAMAEFVLNTGVRRTVVCQLRWDWEVPIKLQAGHEVSVFVVPRHYVKGRKAERIIVCNSVAQRLVDTQRGLHPERVFTYPTRCGTDSSPTYRPLGTMYGPAWRTAREAAGLDDLHVHDLRHTVGMRLRAAGVPERTQNDILWHTQGSMTAHYAVAQLREIYNALEAMNVDDEVGESVNLAAVIRRMHLQALTQKSPADEIAA